MVLKGICCWGTDYCKCELLGLTRNQNVKLTYLFLLLLVLTLPLLFASIKRDSPALIEVLGCEGEDTSKCVSEEMQFRWSSALSTLHLMLMLIMLARSQMSKVGNEGAWLMKIIIIMFFGFMNMFVFSSAFSYLHMISAYISILWYLVQALVIIDLIYSLDMFFNDRAELSEKYHLIKAIISISIIIAAVFFNAISYVHHRAEDDLWVSIVNSIALVLGLLLVLMRSFKVNSLLVYSLVMISANVFGYFLRMDQEEFEESSFSIVQSILVVVTLLGTLAPGSHKIRTKKSSINQLLCLSTSKEEEDNRYVSSNKWIIYHYMFFLICLTLPCILNQHYSQIDNLPEQDHQSWQQIFSMYRVGGWTIFYLVYIWSLAASRCYSQRDFNELEHYFKEFELN